MPVDKSKKVVTTPPDNALSIPRAKSAARAVIALRPLKKIIGAIALLVLVRNIDESAFGAYQIYYSIIGFLATTASLGISNTLARYLPEYFKQGKYALAHRIVQVASRLRFISNVLLLTVIWFFWEPLSALLNIEAYANSYFVFAAVAITFFQSSLLVTVLSSYLLQKQNLLMQSLFSAVKVFGYLIATKYGIDVGTALAVDLIAYIVMLIGMRVAYRTHTPTVGGQTVFPRNEARRIIRYGFFYNFNDMGQFAVGKRIDNFFIASIVDVASVGAYSLATRVLEIIRGFVPDKFFLDVIRPLFFTLDPVEDAGQVTHYFQLLVKSSYIFFTPATAVIILTHSEIFDVIFGGKFLEYSSLLVWMFVFATLIAFDRPLRLVVQLHERAAIVLIGKLFGIYNIVALLMLIPHFGVVGAAIATGSADILRKIFLWWFVRKQASFLGMGRFFVLTAASWFAFYVLLAWVQTFVGSAFWRLVLTTFSAAAWWLLYIRLPLFTGTEEATIRDTAGPRPRKVLRLLGILRSD